MPPKMAIWSIFDSPWWPSYLNQCVFSLYQLKMAKNDQFSLVETAKIKANNFQLICGTCKTIISLSMVAWLIYP